MPVRLRERTQARRATGIAPFQEDLLRFGGRIMQYGQARVRDEADLSSEWTYNQALAYDTEVAWREESTSCRSALRRMPGDEALGEAWQPRDDHV